MFKLSFSTIVGIFILMCMLAAMISIAVMQVIRTVGDLGPVVYIIGGAVFFVGIVIPLMLVLIIKHLKRMS